MNVDNEASEKAKKLLVSLDNLDKQIFEHRAVLIANNVDMSTPLVDEEGFPSATIDIISVRKARHSIICLQNDREKLMSEMSDALAELHQSSSSIIETKTSEEDNFDVHRTTNDPFARIGFVEKNSPAEKANLKENDLIVQFGTLHANNFTGFPQLKKYVQDSGSNATIKVTVYRETEASSSHVHRLKLRPQVWQGPGTLGCSFTPVTKS